MKNKKEVQGFKVKGLGKEDIFFKNFSGKVYENNPQGNRNFCINLIPELAERLTAEGWNVKYFEPRSEFEAPQAYIQLKVAYNNYPPEIYKRTMDGDEELLDENRVGQLDSLSIVKGNITVSPYSWERNGKSGVSAYLRKAVFLVEDDDMFDFD